MSYINSIIWKNQAASMGSPKQRMYCKKTNIILSYGLNTFLFNPKINEGVK